MIHLQKYEKQKIPTPGTSDFSNELKREENRRRQYRSIRNALAVLVVSAAAAILIATLVMPVFRIYGSSMTPTLTEGNLVIATKSTSYEAGDLIAFYFNNKILVKRVIATEGQWVNIDKDGDVYIDNVLLEEPYITEKSLGECDIELPYQVPEGRIFVMGDHRDVSIDSRSASVGCVSDEQIAGKIHFRIWPLGDFKIDS